MATTDHDFSPQPLSSLAPPAPSAPAVGAFSVLTVQQIPFTSTWVVQADGHAVSIDGQQVWPSRPEAEAAAATLG